MTSRLILVDGHALTNKQRVAGMIADRLVHGPILRFDCSQDENASAFVQKIRHVVDDGMTVIIESSWRVDYVRERLGHNPVIAKPFRAMLDRLALGCSVHVAQCHTTKHHLDTSLNQEKLLLIDRVSDSWLDISRGSGMPVSRIDQGSYTDIDIDLMIETMDVKVDKTINEGPGIGAWRPGQVALLVGDRHGPSIQPYQIKANVAFIDMAKAGSSYWLTNKLIEARVPEHKLYWINAYAADGTPTQSEFIERLRPVTVLTLGDAASRWCEVNQVRYEHHKHPQWHKRFHYSEPYPVIERLKELFRE